LVVIAETKDDLIKKLNEWKDSVDNTGMTVTTTTTTIATNVLCPPPGLCWGLPG